MKKLFFTKDWTHGETNAVIKNLGEEDSRRIGAGEKFTITFEKQLTQAEFQKNIIKEFFDIDVDISGIQERKGKRLIIVPIGMIPNKVFDALPFKKYRYSDDLGTSVSKNDRVADKTYVIYVDDVVEADEQFKNKSANDLEKIGHKGVTLTERLLDELYFFKKTGKHLDVGNITLCSGSRNSDGDVPLVYWTLDKLRVGWNGTSYSDDNIRSRSVVSA